MIYLEVVQAIPSAKQGVSSRRWGLRPPPLTFLPDGPNVNRKKRVAFCEQLIQVMHIVLKYINSFANIVECIYWPAI